MTKSKIKKCEICGEKKPLEDFSKSYPNRCKACVAEEVRAQRATQKADAERIRPKLKPGVQRVGNVVGIFKKAHHRYTGEAIEVRPTDETCTCRYHLYVTTDGRKLSADAINFDKEIDWEQRRYEIAKEAVRGVALNEDEFTYIEIKTTVKNALQLADALIAELKKTDDK